MKKHISKIFSAELCGVDARVIDVEVDVMAGKRVFAIVGLADKSLNEARERVNAALKNSRIHPPIQENRRVIVNLAPADVRKTGSQYDVAIALGYLVSSEQMKPFDVGDKIFVGELALDGALRPVSGVLNIAEMAKRGGFTSLFVPAQNANEAAAINGITIFPISNIIELVEFLDGRREITPAQFCVARSVSRDAPDFSEIKGQDNAKRALIVAAAGGHNILMVGPPGVGKSFLARALGGILPELSHDEAIEITKIWSVAGFHLDGLVQHRPFRAPHQTASTVALVGGGQNPRPGEISLAHRGVLFLDELPEFGAVALEALRQPLEDGVVHVARAKQSLIFPARFSLVAAMNPCPCGYYGDSERKCRCSPYEIAKYQKRISGPLLDRIDIQVRVNNVKIEDLRKQNQLLLTPASPVVATHIMRAREAQRDRFIQSRFTAMTNAEMSSRDVDQFVNLDTSAVAFIKTLDKSGLSPRAYYRILKVARTIADLAESNVVTSNYLAEAYGYRLRDES